MIIKIFVHYHYGMPVLIRDMQLRLRVLLPAVVIHYERHRLRHHTVIEQLGGYPLTSVVPYLVKQCLHLRKICTPVDIPEKSVEINVQRSKLLRDEFPVI